MKKLAIISIVALILSGCSLFGGNSQEVYEPLPEPSSRFVDGQSPIVIGESPDVSSAPVPKTVDKNVSSIEPSTSTSSEKKKDYCPAGDKSGNEYDLDCGEKKVDNCPNGDWSPSSYDKTCGVKPVVKVVTPTPAPVKTAKAPVVKKSTAPVIVKKTTAPTAPKLDYCPGGDYSGSRTDGKCGTKPTPAPAVVNPSPATGVSVRSDYEKRIISLTNAYRAANGKPALKVNGTLGTIARNYAIYMAQTGNYSHNSKYFDQAPAGWSSLSENVGRSSYSDPATQIFNEWKNSSSHRANMLSSKYSSMGVGVVCKETICYFVQDFYG